MSDNYNDPEEAELMRVALHPKQGSPVAVIKARFEFDAQHHLALDNLTEEEAQKYQQLALVLKSLVEGELFYWTDVPLEPPSTVFKHEKRLEMADVFKRNTYNELHDVAFENGRQKYLSREQLKELYRTGKFSVDSLNFPDMKHVWQVSGLIAKGTETIKKTLFDWYAFSLRQFTVEIPARLYSGREFSVFKGFEQIATGVRDVVDSIIGLPARQRMYPDHHINTILDRQRMKYIFQDATPSDYYYSEPSFLITPLNEIEKLHFGNQTSFKVDLRYLKNPRGNVSGQINNELNALYATVSSKWEEDRVDFVVSLRKQMGDKNNGAADSSEMAELIATKCVEEKVRRMFDAIAQSEKLQSIALGINTVVLNLWKALRIVRTVENKYNRMLTEFTEATRKRLKQNHPIRSRIGNWLEDKVNQEVDAWTKAHEWDCENEIIECLRAENLPQELFLFTRDMVFRQTLMEPMRAKLSKILRPTKEFERLRQIWNPKNWHIKKYTYETPNKGTKFEYLAIKFDTLTNTTWYPFWRVTNFLNYTYTIWSNGVLAIAMWMTRGPISLRAVFSRKPYYALKTVDKETGKIIDDPYSKMKPLAVNISEIWQNISESRARFEREPDTGLIGKSVTRIINMFWNYVIKGALGTTMIAAATPVLSLLSTSLCLLLICLSIGWAPAIGILRWLFTILIYDFDLDGNSSILPLFQAIIWRILFRGIFCIGGSLASAFVVHPIVSATSWTFSSVSAALQCTYYSLIHYLVIRRNAKIPAHNGFLARRIQGPGIASTIYTQVTPQEAIVFVRAYLEYEELNIWESRMRRIILLPQNLLSTLKIKGALYSLGLMLDTDSSLFSPIHKSCKRLMMSLSKVVQQRRHRIPICENSNLIRQSKTDLEHTKRLAQKLITKFVTERIFTQLTDKQIKDWWTKHDCQPDDFESVTASILRQVFSHAFLEPLEQHDKYISLHLKKTEIPGLTELLGGSTKDPLEEVSYVSDNSPLSYELLDTHHAVELTPFNISPATPRQQALWPLSISWTTLWHAPAHGEEEVDDRVPKRKVD